VAADTTLGIDEEIRRIEEMIREQGSCLMKEDQLRRLFSSADTQTHRYALFARIAYERAWSFEFQPHNGEERIAPLSNSPS
jgi:hypothetical protein